MNDYSYLNNPRPAAAAAHENNRDVNNISPLAYDEYRNGNTLNPTTYDNYQLPSTSTLQGSGVMSPAFDQPGGRGLAPEDEVMLQEADVHWRAVAKPMRLGRATVMCLIFNRMIGASSLSHSYEGAPSFNTQFRYWNLSDTGSRVQLYTVDRRKHGVVGTRGGLCHGWYPGIHGTWPYHSIIQVW